VLLALAIVGLFVLPAPWGVIAVFTAAVIEVGEILFWIRFLRRYPVTTGAEGLVGERGEVIVRCAPLGRVRLRGESWNARSEEPLELGEEVRVEAVDGLTLVVARAGNGARRTALCATPSSPTQPERNRARRAVRKVHSSFARWASVLLGARRAPPLEVIQASAGARSGPAAAPARVEQRDCEAARCSSSTAQAIAGIMGTPLPAG
jgi:membrane protein implicated in regulation of membrane protease activity